MTATTTITMSAQSGSESIYNRKNAKPIIFPSCRHVMYMNAVIHYWFTNVLNGIYTIYTQKLGFIAPLCTTEKNITAQVKTFRFAAVQFLRGCSAYYLCYHVCRLWSRKTKGRRYIHSDGTRAVNLFPFSCAKVVWNHECKEMRSWDSNLWIIFILYFNRLRTTQELLFKLTSRIPRRVHNVNEGRRPGKQKEVTSLINRKHHRSRQW